jgi:hypothetical protein
LNYDYAKEIVNKYNNSGIKAIKNGRQNLKKQRVGKKPLLTKQQLEKLEQELESLPSSEKGIWTGPKVARGKLYGI